MIFTVAEVIVIAIAAIVCVLSAWGIFAPQKLVRLVSGIMEQRSGIYVAVVVRVVLGLALLGSAAGSRYPRVFEVLGWIAILAAVGLAIMGRARLLRFVSWFDRFPPALIRVWLLFGLAFGGFLIYGVS